MQAIEPAGLAARCLRAFAERAGRNDGELGARRSHVPQSGSAAPLAPKAEEHQYSEQVRARGPISIAPICAAVACTGYDRQSVLDPASPQATSIHQLFYFMLAVAVVTYMLVVGALFAVIRNRRYATDDPVSPGRHERAERSVKLAVLVVVPVLFLFLLYNFAVERNVNRMPDGPMLSINVTGNKLWVYATSQALA